MVSFDYPETIKQAVERLTAYLPLNDRVFIANLKAKDLPMVYSLLSSMVRDELGLLFGNRPLLDDCRLRTGNPNLSPEEAFSFIIRFFWETLRRTHALRVVPRDTTKS
jgi:hypothetical protein